jgi:DNA modification methylase
MLVYTILDNFSNEGDVIYDPFMGSGTTAVVSQKMKRKWVGSELSPNYCELIQKRIDELGKELF